ncbi:MAG: ComEC/Rec2 family competence protein [Acidobacteria bacterium]|nr:ComEC/Rec2 family competence protein [Acidobacteriota bacterium]
MTISLSGSLYRERNRIRTPGERQQRQFVVAVLVVWLASAAGQTGTQFYIGAVSVVIGALAILGRRLLAVLCLVGVLTGMAAGQRALVAAAAEWDGVGVVTGTVVLTTTSPEIGFLLRPTMLDRDDVVTRWSGQVMFVVADTVPAVDAIVAVRGASTNRPRWVGGRTITTTVRSRHVEIVAPPRPWFVVGNNIRSRVGEVVTASQRPGAGLLLGFLTGDTSHISKRTLDDMKRSGLTHVVAVSGSNVALFLTGIWLVASALRLSATLRHVLSVVGVWAFVIATRWEPSVIRASVMVSLVLLARLVGVPLDGVRALSLAVIASLLVAPELAGNVGFQLSVAATAGIMLSGVLWRGRTPSWLWRPLAVAVAAQGAVMPILLWQFGAVPLISPLVNVVAGPVVAVSTAAGALGAVAGNAILVDVGSRGAEIVIWFAAFAARWPQLSVAGVGAVASVVFLLRWRRFAWVTAIAVLVAVAVLTRPVGPPSEPTATFLNVGQGDATLLRSPDGAVVLIDGGADPSVLLTALRKRGVDRLDLVIGTHADSDHIGALVDVIATLQVKRMWVPAMQPSAPLMSELIATARRRGVYIEEVQVGDLITVGEFSLRVLGPSRRFKAENDGSVVTWVTADGVSLLLAGDIGGFGQAELPPLHPDLLLVPHHGSNTTDLAWLEQTATGVPVVISVGDNDYGHPTSDVLEALSRAGAVVYRTDIEGDIVMAFSSGEE